MHGSAGLHSAMAIKRQRRLREQAKRRAAERERRLSSRTSSMDSMDHLPNKKMPNNAPPDHRLATSIGMLHIGVCFLVFGLFLIGSGLLPDDVVTWRGGGWWNELVATGIFVAALGIFLIALNRVMSKREEDDLNKYVSNQLTRSRSGHRLERDVETGCLTTKNYRRILEKKRESEERGLAEVAPVHSPLTKIAPVAVQNGDAYLEKIVEEDVFEKAGDDVKPENKETMSTTTTASLSPGTPSETRELITNGAMIGAMPAVAVRHERRKGQEKRSKRPSQLYIGGHWLPPNSPSPTPSPNGPHDDGTDGLPELYFCGKVSALQLVVGSILLGAIVLIVGLVQLVPNAADADHRYIFIGAGSILLILGFILTAVRCFCMHCHRDPQVVLEEAPPALDAVNSIDVLVQRRDTQVTSPSELDALIGHSSQGNDKENSISNT